MDKRREGIREQLGSDILLTGVAENKNGAHGGGRCEEISNNEPKDMGFNPKHGTEESVRNGKD